MAEPKKIYFLDIKDHERDYILGKLDGIRREEIIEEVEFMINFEQSILENNQVAVGACPVINEFIEEER